MLNILINAYAINPHWGSEPGMGWNWVKNLAKYCRLYIITEGEWRQAIEDELAKLPYRDNLTFYYLPMPEKVRRMCWNQGDWRFYFHYRKWQLRALSQAREIIARHHIDIIHQLNMVGFREPGYLWKIEGIPYVWGPVGGMELMPLRYLKGAGWRQIIFCGVKNMINFLQSRYHPRVRHAIQRADILIAAVRGVQKIFECVYHKQSFLINETGTSGSLEKSPRRWFPHKRFNILWVGKFDFRKQLGLAIQTVASAQNNNIHLHICGTGNEEQVQHYQRIARQCGIAKQCHWHGNVEHKKMATIMLKCDLLFFTSIMEATSTVVLEAIDAGLPILSFNTCGFGSIVNRFAGVTMELSTPTQSVKEFAKELNRLEANRSILKRISAHETEQRLSLSWDSKALQTLTLYRMTLQEKYSPNIYANIS